MNYLFDKNLFLKEFKKVLLAVTAVKVAIWFVINPAYLYYTKEQLRGVR